MRYTFRGVACVVPTACGITDRRKWVCMSSYVTRFGKIRINAATNYFCFFLLTGYTGPEDLDFQV